MLTAQTFVSFMVIGIALHLILGAVAYAVLLERKIAGWAQDRLGPNRVGFSFGQSWMPQYHFWGLGQPLADGMKLMLKEDYTPPTVERKLFVLAPALGVIPALIAWAIIPWGGMWEFPGLTVMGYEIAQPGLAWVTAAPLNIGILYVLAVGSLAVYGIVIAGYSSNNKYAFLGGLRATAQMLSYEIPLGICLLIVILASSGQLYADAIVFSQSQGLLGWNIVWMPLVAIIFFVCQLAEANRTPFDLVECEQELVAGFHTEYSSMKFALFMLGEYAHIIGGAAFFTLLFLGGWDVPFITLPAVGGLGLVLLKVGIFSAKTALLVALIILIRWTLPRFRFDQIMKLAWRNVIPITLVLLVFASVIQYLTVAHSLRGAHWWMLASNIVVFVGAVIVGPMLPQGPPVNRRVPLEGSRFSPATPSS